MPTLVHVTHDIELPLPLATIADIVHFGTILQMRHLHCPKTSADITTCRQEMGVLKINH